MNKIIFHITTEEVQQIANGVLNEGQIVEVLSLVENDSGLWSDIERSIKSAIQFVLEQS